MHLLFRLGGKPEKSFYSSLSVYHIGFYIFSYFFRNEILNGLFFPDRLTDKTGRDLHKRCFDDFDIWMILEFPRNIIGSFVHHDIMMLKNDFMIFPLMKTL